MLLNLDYGFFPINPTAYLFVKLQTYRFFQKHARTALPVIIEISATTGSAANVTRKRA